MCYKIELPTEFKKRISTMLPEEELEAFFACYNEERKYGLRYNPLKIGREAFLAECADFQLEKVTWAEEGYYYDPAKQPGKHILHEAGAYYIQEPSAMAVVELLDPKPGERVLDLCAAPGGKSTQIAGRLAGEGMLVSNEIVSNRSKILSQNIERMGVTNCVVTNESPAGLATFFPEFFDKIVVDAPCSGEGMFRKEPEALAQWSPENVALCAERQREILKQAAGMLKPGGVLVYSTCTFSKEENEDCIRDFVTSHPEFDIQKMHRIWPHKEPGEGHFMAKLIKKGCTDPVSEDEKANTTGEKYRKENTCLLTGDKKLVKQVSTFLQDELMLDINQFSGMMHTFGEQVYLLPAGFDRLKGLKIERPGLHLATMKKNRLEPAHGLAMAMQFYHCPKTIPLTATQAVMFLRGESISLDAAQLKEKIHKGWCVVEYAGCSLGFTKVTGNILKNHYPKGLRKDVIF